MELDYGKLRRTPVADEPFRHIVVEHFVPPGTLEEVVADLPLIERRGSFPISALRFGSRAASLMAELEGPTFRAAIAEKFDLDLSDAGTMVTLRGQSRERDGKIHTDSVAKRVTILLYLNPQDAAWARKEGCLRLLRGPENLDDYAVEVPPVNGTLLVFPNGPRTFHGHKQFLGRRYVVQLNYMTADQAARSELRRHKVSALVKRILHAA